MGLDPILKDLIAQASKKFGVSEGLLSSIVAEERLRRYQRSGERRFLDDKLRELLEEHLGK